MSNETAAKFDYDAFREQLEKHKLLDGQSGPLRQRLTLLEGVLAKVAKKWLSGWVGKHKDQKGINIFSFEPGTLTIIDLSSPFINEGGACALFDVCLHLFKDLGPKTGKMVALDEAHKVSFLNPESLGPFILNQGSS